MTQIKKAIVVLAGLCITAFAYAQGLSIGQKINDVRLPNVLNFKSTQASLSDFGHRPVLLDFWNTHCSVGMDLLPKANALQKQFANKVQVLVVAYEDESIIRDALANRELAKGVTLPVVVGDTVLHTLFPHRTEPHLVWIDGERTVRAITGYKELTEQNLLALLTNKGLVLPAKEETADKNVFFSLTPLVVNEYAKNKNKMLVSSYLGTARPDILSSSRVASFDPEEGVTRITTANSSLKGLYKWAYKKFENFHNSLVLVEEENEANLIQPDSGYCYDLLLRGNAKERAYQYMQSDLDRSFGFVSRLGRGKVTVLVLRRTSVNDQIRTKDPHARRIETFEKNGRWIVRNAKLKALVENFNTNNTFPWQLIDETGYREPVDLEMAADFQNIEAVNKSLKPFDLVLDKEQREMELIILRKGR